MSIIHYATVSLQTLVKLDVSGAWLQFYKYCYYCSSNQRCTINTTTVPLLELQECITKIIVYCQLTLPKQW